MRGSKYTLGALRPSHAPNGKIFILWETRGQSTAPISFLFELVLTASVPDIQPTLAAPTLEKCRGQLLVVSALEKYVWSLRPVVTLVKETALTSTVTGSWVDRSDSRQQFCVGCPAINCLARVHPLSTRPGVTDPLRYRNPMPSSVFFHYQSCLRCS